MSGEEGERGMGGYGGRLKVELCAAPVATLGWKRWERQYAAEGRRTEVLGPSRCVLMPECSRTRTSRPALGTHRCTESWCQT